MLAGAMVGYGLMGVEAAVALQVRGSGALLSLVGGSTVIGCAAIAVWLSGRSRSTSVASGQVGLGTRIAGGLVGSLAFMLIGIAVMFVLVGLGSFDLARNLSGFQAWLETMALGGGIGAALGVPTGLVLAGR